MADLIITKSYEGPVMKAYYYDNGRVRVVAGQVEYESPKAATDKNIDDAATYNSVPREEVDKLKATYGIAQVNPK